MMILDFHTCSFPASLPFFSTGKSFFCLVSSLFSFFTRRRRRLTFRSGHQSDRIFAFYLAEVYLTTRSESSLQKKIAKKYLLLRFSSCSNLIDQCYSIDVVTFKYLFRWLDSSQTTYMARVWVCERALVYMLALYIRTLLEESPPIYRYVYALYIRMKLQLSVSI